MNGQTMTASHNGITSQSNQLINFTATGANTTMNSTGSFDARSMVVSGAGNVKVGISSNTMYISAAGGGGVAIAPTGATYTSGTVGLSAMSPLGLSTTNNQTISITAPALSSIVGINGINLATSGNTLSIDGSAIQPGTLSNWEPIMLQNASLTTGTVGAKSIMFMKLSPQAYINASQLLQLVSGALSVTVNSTHSGTLSVQAGIYTANGSTLSLITQSSGSASYTWSNSSSNNTSFFAGLRGITLPMNIKMSPGNYWLGLWSNSTFSNTNVVAMSNMVMSFNAGGAAGFGGLLGQAPNVTAGVQEGVGVYSVTSANLHANAAMSGISQSAFSRVSAPYLNFKNITW
jgi:hypothetical protein